MYEVGVDGVPRLTRTWMIFFERLGRTETAVTTPPEPTESIARQKATFGLLRPLEDEEEDLTNHYIARGAGILRNWTCNAKTPPTGQSAILDIERSVDEGATWFSIFDDDDADKIVIPEDDDTRIDGTAFKADDEETDQTEGRVEEGDFLRINCIRAGLGEPGRDIEVVLEWWEDAE